MSGARPGADAPMVVWMRENGEVLVVAGIVLVVALLVLPLPPVLLDLLLTLSMAASLVVLVVALHTDQPLQFSAFPSLLLLLTLFRLALNVGSTRLILGTGEAGRVIEAFGSFVIGGNYAVGVVVFLILVGINFIVITKGAGRVAEVAARFTLDAMPGRQMSIDGDLSAGLIDDDEARRRRERVSQEADFYGAMDGSAKFVRGDAIAGLLITAINILGGLYVGVVQRDMGVGDALSTYTLLTVGDGLVTQIPALVVSTAAGIMVTASSGGDRVPEAILRQIGRRARPLWIAAGFLASLALVPGLPILPFLSLAVLLGVTAWMAGEEEGEEEPVAEQLPEEEEAEPDPARDLLQLDPVELCVGYGLIPLVDESSGGDLLERIRLLRKQAALETGILVPPIRIRDDVRLDADEYVLKVRGNEVARGEVRPRLLMALDTGGVVEEVEGERTVDPSFGMPARWITRDHLEDAEAAGFTVVEPSTVVATHLMEAVRQNAADLLGRQDVQHLLDTLKTSYPALVEDVVPDRVGVGVLHRVLQRLLREGVPTRDLVTILETLSDVSEQTKDPEVLTEHVRRALAKVIGETFQGPDGQIRGITLGAGLETALMGLFNPRAGRGEGDILDPDTLTRMLTRLESLVRGHGGDGRPVPVIAPPGLRVGIRRLIEPVMPRVPVLSLAELPPQVNLQSVATWEIDHAA
jgi:flagellar biosynthesis protein FlhA